MYVIGTGDRSSIVIELHGISSATTVAAPDARTVVALLGPLTHGVESSRLRAAPGSPLVHEVDVRSVSAPGGGRALRVEVTARTEVTVQLRRAGHRTYIDLTPTSSAAPRLLQAGAPVPDGPPSVELPSGPEWEAGVLARAKELAAQPDVRGLQRLKAEALRRQTAAPRERLPEGAPLLAEIDRLLDEARRRQLEEDARVLRKPAALDNR
jgi:hypothetical protein